MKVQTMFIGILIHCLSIPIFGLFLYHFDNYKDQNLLITLWIIGSFFSFSFMPAIYTKIIDNLFNND